MTLYEDRLSSRPEPGLEAVTKSKLMLLAAWQANKSRDKMLWLGRVTLFWKPEDQEDEPVS